MEQQHQKLYTTITEQIRSLVPAKLITITFCDFASGEVFRVFSTMPNEFTIAGRKPIDKTPSVWNDTIFDNKSCFIIKRVRDYPEHFYDYEHIENLGLCSALCVPIITPDNHMVVGTVNILDAEGSYTNAPLDNLVQIVGQLSSVYGEKLMLSKAG